MKKLVWFLMLFLSIHSSCFSQPPGYLQIKPKLHLLPIINFERHYIQGSVEVIFLKRLGVELGYGRRFKDPHEGPLNYFGESMLIDMNYYSLPLLDKHNVRLRLFGGLGFKKVTDNRNASIEFNRNTMNGFTEKVGVYKKLNIFNTRFGLEIVFCKRFGLDISAEPGLKYKEQSIVSTYWKQDGYAESGEDLYMLGKVPYQGYQPNLNLNLRLFHYFNFKEKKEASSIE